MDIIRLASCASTNDEAKRLAREGAPEGTVVAAAEQTAGRGTQGRPWHSGRGEGLFVSIILRPPLPAIGLLPLLAAEAVREAVETVSGVKAEIKRPNDLVWAGRKLGGILCESGYVGDRLTFAVVGVGLNIGQSRDDFPAELRPTAVSIGMAGGTTLDPESFLVPVVAGVLARARR
jgi:BirA family biotin operon repressor/biotin-[acetyl-CoA-carboxylase] ligase